MIEIARGTIRTVLIDPDPGVLESLESALTSHPRLEIIGRAGSLVEAVDLVDGLDPDLVFLGLDVADAGTDAIDAIRAAGSPELVLMSRTAEDAARAFNVDAVDYLLKPFEADRVHECVGRAEERALARVGPGSWYVEPIQGQVGAAGRVPSRAGPGPSDRILIRDKDQIQLVGVDEIDWIEAEGNYVRIHTAESRYLKRATLTELEKQLQPHGFARIHRSTLVKVSRIQELEPWVGGDYFARLEDGRELKVSRTYRDALMERFI